MLWYKAWQESRARFIFCLVGLQALIVYMVLAHDYVLLAFEKDPATFNYTVVSRKTWNRAKKERQFRA
jgi:hypothetical protein